MFFVKQSISKISKSEELFSKAKYIQASIRKYATINSAEEKQDKEVHHFRTLRIFPMKKKAKKAMQIKNNNPPRTDLMKTDQDWPNVWPGPRTFHPAVVPLPVRQGANQKRPPPGKFVNTELMKIPNFLHLTPLAIERHCNAIKKFCTKWPEDLKREEDMAKHFPVEIITTDYCHSSPTIRDPMARIVSLKIRLKSLDLDEHAKDKFLRLVGPRYDPETGIVTITTDTCPRRYQNYDYAHYLLTALYYESWKYEDWEKDRVDEDQETYFWENRNSKKSVEEVFKYNSREVPDTSQFAQAMEKLMNEEECLANVEQYKEAALKLLSLPELKEEDSLAS